MTVEELFWSKVERTADPTQCWLWTGTRLRGNTGYGVFYPGNIRYAHRFSWTLHHGPIPAGLQILHRCDNPPCVNPGHLWLGSQKDNMKDMHAKRRSWVYTHPEKLARGDRNGMFTHPERRSHPSGERNGSSKLTAAAVALIRARYQPKVTTMDVLAQEFGVTKTAICKVVHGQRWQTTERADGDACEARRAVRA